MQAIMDSKKDPDQISMVMTPGRILILTSMSDCPDLLRCSKDLLRYIIQPCG